MSEPTMSKRSPHLEIGSSGDWRFCVFLWQNAQRLAAGAQAAQSLTTPVVSVATPSLLAQGLNFSAMTTAYNTGELKAKEPKHPLKLCVSFKKTNPGFLFDFYCKESLNNKN